MKRPTPSLHRTDRPLTCSRPDRAALSRLRAPARLERGFTLIELIMVIILVGALSAMVMPRFYDFTQAARIASVNALSGTITTTARQLRTICYADSNGCNVNSQMTGLTYQGVSYGMNYGWIGAGTGIGTGLIDSAITYSGFNVSIWNPWTNFTVPSAPDPNNCGVSYGNAWATGNYSLVVKTSGC